MPVTRAKFCHGNRAYDRTLTKNGGGKLFNGPWVMDFVFVQNVNDDIGVEQNHGSLVIARSSSQVIIGFILLALIAANTSARVFFFGGAGLFRRTRRKWPLPSSSQANTSPGRAPGITTRRLLSAVTVMVG